MARRRKKTHPRHRSLIGHFWSMVDRRGPEECWPWAGACWQSEPGKSYGLFSIRGNYKELAHRFSLEMKNGPLGNRLCLHRCDNPPCVNPAHLYAGDAKQNAKDMVVRGRFPRHFDVLGRYVNLPLVSFMEQKNIGLKEFSEFLGVSSQTLNRWLYGKTTKISKSVRDSILPVLGEEIVSRAFDAQPEDDRRVRVLPEIEASIIEVKKSGMPLRKIARTFGVHYQTVHRIMKRNGFVRPSPKLSAVARLRHQKRRLIHRETA